MTDFRLFREDSSDCFHEIELPYCPRIGEKVWVERKHAKGATHYTFLVRLLLNAETQPHQADMDLLVHKFTDLRDTWAEAVRQAEEEEHARRTA